MKTLWEAACDNEVERVRELLDSGIDIDSRNPDGRTALHDSIENGAQAATEFLLSRGATVDICAAAILGKLERVRELLDADPGLANDRSTGLSPLGWAAFGNQCDAAAELIDHGARMDDHELICAASVGHVEVGRLLIERGADPNAQCGEAGGGPIHAAAAMHYTCDSSAFVTMLLEMGADPELKTPSGYAAEQIVLAGMAMQEGMSEAERAVTESKEFAKVLKVLKG